MEKAVGVGRGAGSKYTQFGAELLGNYEYLRKPKCMNMASESPLLRNMPW